MATTDLLDLTDLISGGYRPDTLPDYHSTKIEADPTAEEALAAIDRVLEKHPGAVWITEGEFGRIVAGELLLSLKFSLIEADAKFRAWCDAAQRLGD